jgi:hypothetical protein
MIGGSRAIYDGDRAMDDGNRAIDGGDEAIDDGGRAMNDEIERWRAKIEPCPGRSNDRRRRSTIDNTK